MGITIDKLRSGAIVGPSPDDTVPINNLRAIEEALEELNVHTRIKLQMLTPERLNEVQLSDSNLTSNFPREDAHYLVRVLSGRGSFMERGGIYSLGVGSWVYVPNGLEFNMQSGPKSTQANPFRFVWAKLGHH